MIEEVSGDGKGQSRASVPLAVTRRRETIAPAARPADQGRRTANSTHAHVWNSPLLTPLACLQQFTNPCFETRTVAGRKTVAVGRTEWSKRPACRNPLWRNGCTRRKAGPAHPGRRRVNSTRAHVWNSTLLATRGVYENMIRDAWSVGVVCQHALRSESHTCACVGFRPSRGADNAQSAP